VQFPLLTPTTFFLLVINIVYAFFDTFAIVDAATSGGPGQGHRDPGLQGLLRRLQGHGPRRFGGAVGGADGDRGALTVVQFRYVESG
jgi:sn-glycerol 3-phosphate transport system permease protein